MEQGYNNIKDIDYLNNPIKVIDYLFNENENYLNDGTIYKNFETILSNSSNYQSIPLISTINQCDLNNGKLVKIRCMIQDIFDPQFCPTTYKIKNLKTNKIRVEAAKYKDDFVNLKDDEELIIDQFDSTSPYDKSILYCIPIPCENKWLNDNENENNNSNNDINNNIGNNITNKKKRNIDNIDGDDKITEIKKTKEGVESKITESKTTTTSKGFTKKFDINKIFNYPIQIESNNEIKMKTPFIVNIYDDNICSNSGSDSNNKEEKDEVDEEGCGESKTFKINEIVEFIGIVPKFNPTTPTSNEIVPPDETPVIIDLMSMLDVDEISTIPDSLIPQFNAITYRFLDPYKLNNNNDINPFSKEKTSKATTTTTTTTTTTITTSSNTLNTLNTDIRKELINFISKFIIDPTLSEYLLFFMLSKVYSFTAGLCIGNFSLNISIPPTSGGGGDGDGDGDDKNSFNYLPEIIELLFSELLPRSYRYPMTLENLNDSNIIPFKDYDRNRIVSGVLQLPKSTTLILDETKLKEGKIESQGVKALNSFNKLSIQQKVEYDFMYHPIEIQTDLPILSISYGKSLVTTTTQININTKSINKLPSLIEINEIIYSENTKQKINQFRQYINNCKNLSFQLLSKSNDHHNETTTFIQEDFVKSRQSDPNLNADVFHYWLTLSRLVAISYQNTFITIDKWNTMKSLEEIRKSNL